MRFGFITLGPNVPSTRFRFLPYLPRIESQGHQCHLWMSFPSVYEHIPWLGWRISHRVKRSMRNWQLMQARILGPDCIYLERGCLNDDSLDFDRAFRKTTRRLVLDVDDGIFLERPAKIDALISMADHVVVSTETIQEYVCQRHDQVTLIPTAVPTTTFKPRADAKPPRKITIGWMGTAPTMPFLSVCAEPLRTLADRHVFELLVIGPSSEPLRKIDLRGVDVRFLRWDGATEVQQLQQFDIGVMPLPGGKDWMRYKAATKLVQYMAIGIPAVATPIGVNTHILKNNEVGIAATTTDQWIEALELLMVDEQLRKKMGAAGREKAVTTYSIEANSDRLLSVLRGDG